MSGIEKLTAEQEALFPVYRDKWLRIGLGSGETDKKKAEIAIKLAYKCANLSPPTRFVWCESPLHNAFARQSVRQSVEQSVRQSVWQSVEQSVEQSVRQSVRQSVGQSVWQSVEQSVWQSVEQSVWQSVRQSVWQSVEQSVWQSVRQSVYGSHEAGWLSFYEYMQEVLHIDCAKLSGLFECAQECGWFMPFKELCIVSPKPKKLTTWQNERGIKVIHGDGEPAIYYCDDFKIYGWRGVRMPEEYGSIHSSKWEAKWLLNEQNAELRRCLIQGIGYDRLLSELEAKRLDSWREYNLFVIEQNIDLEPIKLLSMICPSTKRKHIHRVPPQVSGAHEAMTWCNWGHEPTKFLIEH